MSSVYSPTPVALGNITLPDDGDTIEAADVNVPFAAIADGVRFSSPRRDVRTVACTFTVPATVTKVWVTMRGPGGGGGGGAYGGETGSTLPSSGGGGGGAGEVHNRVELTVTPAEVLTFALGTVGSAGVGSGSTSGGNGGDATNATLVNGSAVTLLTSRGGLGGGGGQRNIIGGNIASSIGGHSSSRQNGTLAKTIPTTTATAAEQDALRAFAYIGLGPGAGSTTAVDRAGAYSTPLAWPTPSGLSATNGANGATSGGGGGGGGGCALVVGGAGGAGGAGNAGGAGVAGSAGAAAAAASGGGGGGGGSGGYGNGANGGAGANGAVGVTGYIIFEYFGPAAVIA